MLSRKYKIPKSHEPNQGWLQAIINLTFIAVVVLVFLYAMYLNFTYLFSSLGL